MVPLAPQGYQRRSIGVPWYHSGTGGAREGYEGVSLMTGARKGLGAPHRGTIGVAFRCTRDAADV